MMSNLDLEDLGTVMGGAAAPTTPDSSFGRCGPGSSWKFLGNVYTPECRIHDAAVKAGLDKGSSYLMANLQALPKLPAAIGSYLRARF
jgi:hypothetical protein